MPDVLSEQHICALLAHARTTASVSCILCAEHLHNAPQTEQGLPVDEWQGRIRMAKQSVDALSLKDVQLGLENDQFIAKKTTSGKSDSGQSSQEC